MKSLYIILIPIISSFGCYDKKAKNDSGAKKVVEEFYSWYISDAYKNKFDYYQVPPFKKIAEGKYVFDKDELVRRLNGIRFFSERLKAELLNKLEVCNQQMQKQIWDSEPEPQFNIAECNYLWFDNWVGGQGEEIDGYNVIDEKVQGNNVEIIVEIMINKKRFTKSKVLTVKEGGAYKIDNIELVWK
jgi:hypothetical protein